MSEIEKKEKPTFTKDVQNIVKGIHNFVSKSDIQFAVDNFEVKKDSKNNVEVSVKSGKTKTKAQLSSTGNLSVEIKSEE